MPVTPFHFGPGGLIHALAPRQVSFLAFCTANVLIDIEPLYFMLTRQYPLHRFFHTYVGATLVVVATLALFVVARWVTLRLWPPVMGRGSVARFVLPGLFKWRDLGLLPVTLGALAGSCSHVILDSLMHSDITPFEPFSSANPLFRMVSLGTLHWGCLAAGVAAVCILTIRRWGQGGVAR